MQGRSTKTPARRAKPASVTTSHILDAEFLTPAGHRYILKSDHRTRPTEHKSVWLVTTHEEVGCFDFANTAGWTMDGTGWGLHLISAVPQVLGHNLVAKVKIGKFVSDPPNVVWHGYPADYRAKPQDRPPHDVLAIWRGAGIIEKHEMARIRQGRPCSLSG